MPHLIQAHLDDLHRSGLTDETIAAAGFYSLTPEQIPALTKCQVHNKSGYAIPYPGCQFGDGAPYLRVRLDQPFTGKDGTTVRYLSRKGERNRLYLPPLLPLNWATDPSIPLTLIEGEKKALAACQAGIPCVGLSGVWCWLSKLGSAAQSLPLPDLCNIVWVNREVSICYDSDIVTNEKVQEAEEALTKELTARGAKVRRVRLPAGPDGSKVGLDDYLLTHTGDDFLQLPSLPAPGKETRGRTIDYLDLATTDPGEIAWVLERLFAQQTVNIIGGDAGLGKTWIGLTMAHAVASGRPWLGRFPVCAGPVVFYDEESAPILLHHRIALLRRAEPDLPADLQIRYRLDTGLQVDTPEGVALIEEDLEKLAPALVVIDSFRACFAGDENRSAEVRVALQNLRRIAQEWSCAIVVLHHTRKISQASNASSQMLRGSTDLRGAVDNHVFLRAREPGSLIVEHEKSRWAPPVDTFGIQFISSDDGGLSLHYVADVNPEGDKIDEAKLAIISEVEESKEPVTRQALLARAKAVGVSRRTAERAVGELEESKRIVRLGKHGRNILYGRNVSADLALL